MSTRGKVRTLAEACADCGAPDPAWASINRGVLVCDECCSVHRSLGRHISQVKSLKKGQWSAAQLAMVQQLSSHGANNIWEYTLLDPSQNKHGRRKPSARDQVHPVKSDFIRAKYQFLSFINKHKDGDINSVDDLSKQLHSCVRTSNLETCLRLLSKGADPNYLHPEKGNCPLHVASMLSQPLQVELLVVYGADPGASDIHGKTPIDKARAESLTDLADRLVECQYELTDRLAFFLCGRKPDHQTGQHFIIPEMADSSLDMSELAKQAKKKLQALPNHLFEELAMDVYDEVDRRENDTIWTTCDQTSVVSDRQTVPFLPVNPEFSATRNQGRQKLARFNAREFTTLIIDILSDAKRRQTGILSPVQTPKEPDKRESLPDFRPSKVNSFMSDDEPLYDSVASDEDYSSIDTLSIKSMKEEKRERLAENPVAETIVEQPVSTEEYLSMKKAMAVSDNRIKQLVQRNHTLEQELARLHEMVQRLIQENNALRSDRANGNLPNGLDMDKSSEIIELRPIRQSPRPQSMFEPRDQQRLSQKSQSKEEMISAQSVSNIHLQEEGQCPSPNPDTTTDPTSHYANPSSLPVESAIQQRILDGTKEAYTDGSSSSGLGTVEEGEMEGDEQRESLPTQDEVVRKTEKITKKIQELLQSAQIGNFESYGPCSDKIQAAVIDMSTLFPKKLRSESIKCALHLLLTSALRLQEECNVSVEPVPMATPEAEYEARLRTQQIIQVAYDVAKAAKQLVTLFQ